MQTPGAAWVSRFLRPLLARGLPQGSPLRCLQVAGADTTEAEQLCALGHSCDILPAGTGSRLKVPDAAYDFAFTGRFPVLAADEAHRVALAREFCRVLRPGGALLLVFGNRLCPVDLTRNGPLLHGPGVAQCLSLGEVRRIFLERSGFAQFRPLSVYGHYGWNQLPALLRPAGTVLDAYWRWIATPDRRWLYFSLLNPTLALWLNKTL